MDEARLIDKLRLIEALFSGATTEVERLLRENRRRRSVLQGDVVADLGAADAVPAADPVVGQPLPVPVVLQVPPGDADRVFRDEPRPGLLLLARPRLHRLLEAEPAAATG